MSSGFANIPKTAPFSEEDVALLNRVVGPANAVQRAWLAGFLAGVEVRDRPAGATGGAGAAGRAADHRLCERVRKFGKACRRHCQGGAQERPQAECHRHGGSRSRGAHLGQEARFDRRDLGRGRPAGARRAGLQRADGRGRAAPRRRRIRRAGAGRHRLCGILRHRQEDRRTPRGPRRQARRRPRRLRSRFRRAGGATGSATR